MPLPDVRGIPLCADILFMATAGLVSSMPAPTNSFVGVSGFAGTLDPTTGEAAGSVDLTQLGIASLDNIPLTLAWVTLDANLVVDGGSLLR